MGRGGVGRMDGMTFSGVMEIASVASWLHSCVHSLKTHCTTCLKYLHFIVMKFYLKVDLSRRKPEEKSLGCIVWFGKMD